MRRSLLAAACALAACSKTTPTEMDVPTMRTNLDELSKLLTLPPGIVGADWQTGKFAAHGSDWWLAAIVRLAAGDGARLWPGAAEAELLETPRGMALQGAFAALRHLPGAQAAADGGVRWVAPRHDPTPLARTPLLDGFVVKLEADTVLVVLHTR